MQHSKITIVLLTCFLAISPFVGAREALLCDYYDLYSEFIVTFPKGSRLGNFGTNASSGITFIFPDKSTLEISPTIEAYIPDDPDPFFSRRDDENFVLEHAKDGCKVTKETKNEIDKRSKIICKNHEYTIIAADNQDHRTYIRLYYDFKSRKYDSLYHRIVDSLVVVPPNPQYESEFYDTVTQAGVDASYFQHVASRKPVNMNRRILNILCGSDRIRDELLLAPTLKNQKQEREDASAWNVPPYALGVTCSKPGFFAFYNSFKKLADNLNTNVDFIMAQAAQESGWGTSAIYFILPDGKRYNPNVVSTSIAKDFKAWAEGKWGKAVNGAKTFDEYLNRLIDAKYTEHPERYRQEIESLYKSVLERKTQCGILD